MLIVVILSIIKLFLLVLSALMMRIFMLSVVKMLDVILQGFYEGFYLVALLS
jgi:hypothetical protein